MKAVPNLRHTSRQTAAEGNSASSSEKSGPRQALGKLRAVLASLDDEMAEDNFTDQKFQDQMRDWELLHEEAMKAIRTAASCEHRSFKRRMIGQAALSGISFAYYPIDSGESNPSAPIRNHRGLTS